MVVSLGGRDLLGSPADAAEFVRVHDGSAFNYIKRIDLPPLSTDCQSQIPYGRYVFVRSDGSRYYVLARRSGFSWGGWRMASRAWTRKPSGRW